MVTECLLYAMVSSEAQGCVRGKQTPQKQNFCPGADALIVATSRALNEGTRSILTSEVMHEQSLTDASQHAKRPAVFSEKKEEKYAKRAP